MFGSFSAVKIGIKLNLAGKISNKADEQQSFIRKSVS